jgi:hypothetical protein
MEFDVPDTYQSKNGVVKVPAICWYTTLHISKYHENMVLFRKYNPEAYPKYDNYDAINVDKTCDIPEDYDGAMGVPISFLDKYNPKQFEIIGNMASTQIDNYNFGYPFINGNKKYARILIKRKIV